MCLRKPVCIACTWRDLYDWCTILIPQDHHHHHNLNLNLVLRHCHVQHLLLWWVPWGSCWRDCGNRIPSGTARNGRTLWIPVPVKHGAAVHGQSAAHRNHKCWREEKGPALVLSEPVIREASAPPPSQRQNSHFFFANWLSLSYYADSLIWISCSCW